MAVPEHATGGPRDLLAHPALRRLAFTDVCARLPQGMVSVTLLLVASRHATPGAAGAAVGGYSLGQALTAALRGRLADRRGLRAVVPVCLAGHLTALTALAVAVAHHAPGAVPAAAAAAGLLTPPLSPAMRALWARRTPPGLRRAGFAADAVIFDLTAIAGPALAGALATGVNPYAALAVLLALTAAASAVVAAGAPGPEPREPAPAHPASSSPLRAPALRRLLLAAALTNLALTATEVALTARLHQAGALWASGPLLAAVSAGSIAGSLLLGAPAPRTPASRTGAARRPACADRRNPCAPPGRVPGRAGGAA